MNGVIVSSPANDGAVASFIPLIAGDVALELQVFVAIAVSSIDPSGCAVKLRFVLQLPAPSVVDTPMRVAFAKIRIGTLVSAVPPTVNATALAVLMQNPAVGD